MLSVAFPRRQDFEVSSFLLPFPLFLLLNRINFSFPPLAAKTLLDDGFKSVHLVSEVRFALPFSRMIRSASLRSLPTLTSLPFRDNQTLSAGGIWALDDSGMSYPGLLVRTVFLLSGRRDETS